jgi:nucleoside-diphosphate-sugar epimerase
MTERSALVTGAGGFIGHHMVRFLVGCGYQVRGVDVKPPQFSESMAHDFEILDLREYENCERAVHGVDEVYHLAADMGGIGYITQVHADVARHNVLVDAHMLEAARREGVRVFFYASSACVYPVRLQQEPDARPLMEEDAYPADAEPGYGWEKLYAELMCRYYRADHGVETRIARFHNIYGPEGTIEGGREKAPAAVCRKIALASSGDVVEVWGDGRQTRSFTYVDDCVEGIYRIAQCPYPEPLNLGSDELVTIDELYDLVADIAGKRIEKRHDLSAPQGVRGRNSDNGLCRKTLGWEPQVPIREGLAKTYAWVRSQLASPVGAARR